MEQLTVRGLGDELARAIQRLANRDGTSLNRAAVKLLRQGAGLTDGQGPDTVGSSLDHLIGTWSDAYSQLMRGREQVTRIVRGAEEVLLSAVVLGELMYGFRHGSHYERNAREMRAFLDNPYVSLVPVGETTADRHFEHVDGIAWVRLRAERGPARPPL